MNSPRAESVASTGPLFDPLAPELVSNPYPIYARLREQDPVHFEASTQAWLLSR